VIISESLKKLPNRITMFRIIITFAFIPAIMAEDIFYNYIALAIFLVASISDFIDGYLARKYDIVSNFGKVMDPLADKILVLAALLCFVHLQVIPVWMVIIVISRDFFIQGIRQMAAQEGKIIAASNWGKVKTVIEMIAIITTLILISLNNSLTHYKILLPEFMNIESKTWMLKIIPYILMFFAAAAALISGLEYFFKNKNIFDAEL
jgi:CDP-diacylglycerol--glycerol-3-phosphate 3-phosphatidyltransferase